MTLVRVITLSNPGGKGGDLPGGSADEVIPDVIDRLSVGAEPTARGFRHVDGAAVGEQGQLPIGCRSGWVLLAEWAAVLTLEGGCRRAGTASELRCPREARAGGGARRGG